MKKLVLLTAVAALLALTISSCTKTGATGPTGPGGASGPTGSTGPSLTGTMTGYVTTYDQYGYKVQGDQAGVSVIIDSMGADSTLTSAAGFYSFANIKTGVYNITYNKTGYASYTAQDYAFVGGGTQTRNTTLSRYPSFSVFGVNDTIETVAGGVGILIRGTDTADANPRSLIIFGNSSSAISPAPGGNVFSITGNTTTIRAAATTWSTFIPAQDLHDAGLSSGSTAYFAVYPISTGAPTYIDQATGKTVYTAISANSPTVLTVTVP